MRRRPGPERQSVEFVDAVVAPGGPPDWPSPRIGRRAVVAAGAVLLAALVVVALLTSPGHTSRTAAASSRPRPAPSGRSSAVVLPTRPMRALFARALPGSVVVAEQTRTTRRADGARALRSRLLEVVVGNVQVDVAVHQRPYRMRLPGSTRLRQGAFVVDFAFSGFYPPSRAVLRAIAGDPRLTSARG